MITLLIWVLLMGVVAYVISALPMPQPFKVAAYGILVIVLILTLSNALGYPVLTDGRHSRLLH